MRSNSAIGPILALSFLFTACQSVPSGSAPIEAQAAPDALRIKSLLLDQRDAWNAGDIEGFMQGYWRSPDLRFASGGEVTRGWTPTLERYKARYASKAEMGELSFTDLEVDRVSADAAILHGRWRLVRANDAPSGLFTLVLRRIDGDWKIVSDTTTSAG